MKKPFNIFIIFLLVLASNVQAQFQLNGSATVIQGDSFQLTPATQWQGGAVWYKIQHSLDEYFTVSGKMYFGSDDNGADGIVFVMQDNCLVEGTTGGGIGYEGLIGKSIGIEFDIFQNVGFPTFDPSYDHIAIHRDGNIGHNGANNLAGPVQMHKAKPDVEDGIWYNYRIDYNPVTTTLDVFFDDSLRVSHIIDLKNNVFGGEDYVYWGFTSATGGEFAPNSVYIADANFSIQDDTLCSGTATVSLPPLSVANISLSKNVVASSNSGAATNVADGNVATTWPSASSNTEWIYLDLGDFYQVDSVTIDWVPAPDRFGEDYLIQTSADAISWTTQATVSGGNGGFDRHVFTANNVRYVKMQGVKIAGAGAAYDIQEFRVYSELQYAWSPNDGSIDDTTSRNPTFSPTKTTTYTVKIPNQCADPIEFQYTIVVGDSSGFSANASDTTICKGDTVQLTGFDGLEYNWSDGLEDSAFVSPSSDKTYHLVGRNRYGCYQFDTVRVYVKDVTQANFAYGIDGGEVSFINGSSNANFYSWNFGDGGTSNDVDPIYEYTEEGEFRVALLAVEQEYGCEDTISSLLNIILPCEVDAPTAFTPDGDNMNDTWNLGCFELGEGKVKVYNRWGSLVFKTEGGENYTAWDGKGMGGSDLPAGSYYYVLEGVEVVEDKMSGTVTIIR